MRAWLIAATAILIAAPALANDFEQSDTWLEYCETGFDENAFEATACVGYVHGFTDAATVEMALPGSMAAVSKCMPENLTNQQARAVWVKYLREHPEKHHLPPSVTLWLALKAAFPCPPSD